MSVLIEKEKLLREYFARQHDVLCVYLFGTVARQRDTASSDVDIAVLYDATVPVSDYTDRQITLSVELSDLLGRNADIIILNRAAPFLKFEIIRGGTRVYERPGRVGRSFEARSIVEYFDIQPVLELTQSGVIRRLKEAPLRG